MISYNFNPSQIEAQIRANAAQIVREVPLIVCTEIGLQLNQGASRRGATPSEPGDPPHKMDGHLARSWQLGKEHNVVDESKLASSNPRIRVGSNLPYARIHEWGGVIKAKQGKFLAVPLNQKARDLRKRNSKLRELNLTLIVTKKGKRLLVDTDNTKGGLAWMPLFVLTKSVRMPERPYVRPGVEKARAKVFKRFTVKRLLRGIV